MTEVGPSSRVSIKLAVALALAANLFFAGVAAASTYFGLRTEIRTAIDESEERAKELIAEHVGTGHPATATRMSPDTDRALDRIEKRLERLEEKVDRLLEAKAKR